MKYDLGRGALIDKIASEVGAEFLIAVRFDTD